MKKCISIKMLNTFAVGVYANQVITIYNESSLLKFWKKNQNSGRSILVLGEGSNVLFLEDYRGVILLNRIKGIFVTEGKMEWKLHVGAGEKWHELVMYTINKNMPGLENLASIPGYVGAAPIQNIGAYGLELAQVCTYVDVLELKKGRKIRFNCEECCFQYRESIFRWNLYKYIILFVGLKLNSINTDSVTPRFILNVIITMRSRKLPSPMIHGNAGSFFKNPILEANRVYPLLKSFPHMPYYYQSDGKIKLLAGWLIENCQLKGFVLGEASVYYKHALILINNRQRATGTEIVALALYIYDKVIKKFDIYLQPEVRLIGGSGEINPKKIFRKLNI